MLSAKMWGTSPPVVYQHFKQAALERSFKFQLIQTKANKSLALSCPERFDQPMVWDYDFMTLNFSYLQLIFRTCVNGSEWIKSSIVSSIIAIQYQPGIFQGQKY